MTELFESEPPRHPPGAGRREVAKWIVGGLVLVALAAGIFYQFVSWQRSPAKDSRTSTGLSGDELAYAAKLQLVDLSIDRAENFLNQEVTTLSVDIRNGGDRSLRALAVTAEFSDELRQVVLRETRPILAPGAAPFIPGERRTFEISFEHIPATWNLQQPSLRIAGLEFSAPTQ